MEPDVLTYQHAAARPPSDDDADPPFRLKCSFLHQVEEPGTLPLSLANGFRDTPGEEAGFADFAVFADQAAHPWCCGFAGATTPSNALREARDVITDSEPRSSRRRLRLRTQDAPQMAPASEDQDSLSFKGTSENSEPKLSSLASREDHTEEDCEEHEVDDACSASQGTSPTSTRSSQFLADDSSGARGLPASDSFADFCSATAQQDACQMWAHFKDHHDNRTQQLLRSSFPKTEVPPVGQEAEAEAEEEVPSLEALLHPRHLLDREEGADERARPDFWLAHRDARLVAGLKFQWGSSHTKRTLLRCLGVASTSEDCYPQHTLTSHKTQTHSRGPPNQLNATMR